METSTRLHPLLTAAAISVTLFSAVGVAAIAGLIPHSKGEPKEATPVAAIEAPAAQPAAAPVVEPAPVAKPAKKPVVRHTPKPAPAPTVAYNGAAVPPPPPLAQAPQTVEAAKPVRQPGNYGVVESVHEVEVKGDAKGVGAVGGGVAGAVLGHNIGDHNKLVTVLGAAGGALLGNQIEKQARTSKQWEMTVRYEDGTTQSFQTKEQPFWHQGDHVRYYEGKLQPV
jgi:outer membrane lipoprotein SlyB